MIFTNKPYSLRQLYYKPHLMPKDGSILPP